MSPFAGNRATRGQQAEGDRVQDRQQSAASVSASQQPRIDPFVSHI